MDKTCGCGCGAPVTRTYVVGHSRRALTRNPHETNSQLFWRYVDKSGTCWLWLGPKDGGGYGRFKPDKEPKVAAHRFAYRDVVGAIPAGLVIDHLCRNPPCVNPEHLEVVTLGENARRGVRIPKQFCKNGHEFTVENTRVTKTGRACRACDRVRFADRYWNRGARESQRARRSAA